MAPIKPKEGPAAQRPTDQSRREALKQFGRFAVVAPTTVLLLAPRAGQAHHKGSHGKGRAWKKPGRGGGYED